MNKQFYKSRPTSVCSKLNLLFLAARDMRVFMLQWYKKFPDLKSRELFLTGESYAGLTNIIQSSVRYLDFFSCDSYSGVFQDLISRLEHVNRREYWFLEGPIFFSLIP